MKKYALSLLCASLAGLAWASDAPPKPLPPAGAEPAVMAPAPAVAVENPACGAPCVVKVCVPEPTVKKTERAIYDQKCVDYCLPHCSLFSLFGGGDCGCNDRGCLNCGSPRTRNVLIKKIVHEECPDVKCTVKEQLPCAAAEAPAPCLHGK